MDPNVLKDEIVKILENKNGGDISVIDLANKVELQIFRYCNGQKSFACKSISRSN